MSEILAEINSQPGLTASERRSNEMGVSALEGIPWGGSLEAPNHDAESFGPPDVLIEDVIHWEVLGL